MENKAEKLVNRFQIDRENNRRSNKERKFTNCDVLAAQTRGNENSLCKSLLNDSDVDVVEAEVTQQEPNFAWRLGNLWKLTEDQGFAQLRDIQRVTDILLDKFDKYADEEQKNRTDELWKEQENVGFELLDKIESSVNYLLSSKQSEERQTKPVFDCRQRRWKEMILQPSIDVEIPVREPPIAEKKSHKEEIEETEDEEEEEEEENRNFLTINIDGENHLALFDSGAQVSVIKSHTLHPRYKKLMHPTNVHIRGISEKCVKADGELDVEIKIDGHLGIISFLVGKICSDTAPVILGMDFINEFSCEAKLAKGYWRVHNGKWHKFSKKSKDNRVHLHGRSISHL